MKLIKRGDKLPETFRATCYHCGSIMEEKRTHLKVQCGNQREPGEYAKLDCMVCGKEISFYPYKGENL